MDGQHHAPAAVTPEVTRYPLYTLTDSSYPLDVIQPVKEISLVYRNGRLITELTAL
jgi:hypothetical protein